MDREFWELADEQVVYSVQYSEQPESIEQIWPDKALVKTASYLFLVDAHGRNTLVSVSPTSRSH